MNQTNLNLGEKRFEQLLKLYLKQRSSNSTATVTEHLDEDLLTAFAEGKLNERAETPIVIHLIECSACRRSVFYILRLTEQFETNTNSAAALPVGKDSFHEFWNELKAKIFNLKTNTVFAHQEAAKSEKPIRADGKEDVS